jgi:hypothetical protein
VVASVAAFVVIGTGWSGAPERSVVPPSPAVLEVASLGRGHLAAHWAWSWSTRAFDDGRPEAVDGAWLAHALDPQWSVPLAYGGLMARSLGDPRSEDLWEAGAQRFPGDPWFRRALGRAP